MLSVVGWGGLLALGAFLNHDDAKNPLRPLIVVAFVGLFLAWWLWLLNGRRGRELAERARERDLSAIHRDS
jgi:membrane protein DedA with SNARE-associated domain